LGHRQPEALRDGADGLRERERLRLHHEAEDVAVLAAAETVVEAALLAHRERRRLLGVERTEADDRAAALAERHDVPDDLGEAGALADVLDGLGWNASPHGRRPHTGLAAEPSSRPTSSALEATRMSGGPSIERWMAICIAGFG